MDWFPLYIDLAQLSVLLPEYEENQFYREQNIDAMLQSLECRGLNGFFKDIESAIEHVDLGSEAIIHFDSSFLMMDFTLPDTDPGSAISEAKAIRFEYNTIDIYDYSDSYFKKRRIRIPMNLPFQHIYPGNVKSMLQLSSIYSMLWSSSRQDNQQSKRIKLDVFGRLRKRYSFYMIDPIYVRIILR